MAPVYEITDQFYVLHTNCFVKIGECHHVKFLCFIGSEISAGNKL